MKRFIIKKNISKKPLRQHQTTIISKSNKDVVVENKEEKKINDMDTQEKIMLANAVLGQAEDSVTKVKKVRKDKGLIEKTESSKIILTEDNRELLIG